MRIISGKLRGRRLTSPADKRVRPTSDMVKEAIFSMILEYLDEDCVCVDLFSGTGNLGLEAISRGAARVYFSDKAKDSIALTRENIKYCKVEDQSVVIQGNYIQTLGRIREKADIFFLDPPYQEGFLLEVLQEILKKDVLSPGGIVVAEHSGREVLPDQLDGLRKVKDKQYGNIGVTVYELEE